MAFERAMIEANVWHAYDEGGGFVIDEGLDFRRSLTKRGQTYWESLVPEGAVPPKSAIDPSHIVPLLPHVVLIDIVRDAGRGRDYVVRLMGTEVARMFGDGTGRPVSEGLSGKTLFRTRATLDHVARTGTPARLASVSGYENMEWLNGEGFYGPLLGDGGALEHVIIVFDVWSSQAPVVPPEKMD